MAEHQGRTDYASKRSRTRAAHTRYLPSPPAATLYTRKNTRFRIPASSQHKPHATFMQPLQCILQHHVSNPHVSTHMATERDNNHAAITLRSAKQIPKNPIAHINNHTWQNTKGEPITHRNAAAPAPHTQGTFHRRLRPLHTEKHKVSYSGFLPNTSPMRHSCSHYNAFCSITCLTRMPRHTWQQNVTTIMQPLHCDLQKQIPKNPIAHINNHTWQNTKGEPITHQNDRNRARRTHTQGAFHRRLQPLYTEEHRVSFSSFLSNTSPMRHSCSHYNRVCLTPPFMNVLLCDVKSHNRFMNVLLCDVKLHTTLHECTVMWCKVSHCPSWMYCYVI